MPATLSGFLFELDSVDPFEITSAIIKKDHASIDWNDGRDRGHLEARSDDGELYTGTYGYPRLDPLCHTILRLYRAKNGDQLLFGSWQQEDKGIVKKGYWAFRLPHKATT